MTRHAPPAELLHLTATLALALLPIVAAGLCIVLMKRSIPALLVAIALLVCGEGLTTGQGVGESLLSVFQGQVKASVFTVLLLSAGVALINGGPARGFAQKLVLRIPHPDLRLLVGIVLGALTGFGSSSMAAQFLADLFGSRESPGAPPAVITGACTFGSLLVPISVWWIYFASFGQTGKTPHVSTAPTVWLLVVPACFCAFLTLLLIAGRRKARGSQRRAHDVRDWLRPRAAAPRLRAGLSWLVFFAVVIAYGPVLKALSRQPSGDWDLPTGALLATVLAGGLLIRQDMAGSLQALWPLPRSGAGAEKAADAYQEARAATAAVFPARSAGPAALCRALPPSAAARATHLLFRTSSAGPVHFRQREGAALARLRLSISRQWALWEYGLTRGLSAALVFITAIVFKTYYVQYQQALGLHLDFAGLSGLLSVPGPDRWLCNLAGCLIVIAVLGGIGGYLIGTAFGTFALVYSLLGVALDQMAVQHAVLPHAYVPMLVGWLIAVSAAINSCSPRADNVSVAAAQLGVAPEVLDRAARAPLIQALLLSLAVALLLPLVVVPLHLIR